MIRNSIIISTNQTGLYIHLQLSYSNVLLGYNPVLKRCCNSSAC
ncbi:MAG: hypothetical protein CMIDDMOC_00754 [Sodalis sp. Fle]|nr:MAG: hypothetical protein CMIDDMOC_00754 [Sodalis sp. Fle]